MATEPPPPPVQQAPQPPQAPLPQPPPPPPPGASREEWHEWRRRHREYVRAQWRHGYYGPWAWGWFGGGWGWFWGAALVVVGVYYLLFNLGWLDWLRGDVLWPILLILLGVALLVGRSRAWWR